MSVHIITGDCRLVLPTLAAYSFDSCVTDPPYGLGFMGKDWDHGIPGIHFWQEVYRVLKPGAHLVAFGGTRTYHRLTCAIEDTGFEIRDCLGWLYGSGFPKSKNIGDGMGTALKPAWEPIILARKPLIGTVASNVQEHGTGALNIDGCRIETTDGYTENAVTQGINTAKTSYDPRQEPRKFQPASGRWPANIAHDGSEEVLAVFAESTGQLTAASTTKNQNCYGEMRRGRGDEPSADSDNNGAVGFAMHPGARRLDTGSAARFFYCAKASREDRNEGLSGFDKRMPHPLGGDGRAWDIAGSNSLARENHHPTVKPTKLMRWLCRLVTPPSGTVLDPFMGSGSTGKAADIEGFNFVGIELNPEYIEIAKARIAGTAPLFAQVMVSC